jgi:hypothetical protein
MLFFISCPSAYSDRGSFIPAYPACSTQFDAGVEAIDGSLLPVTAVDTVVTIVCFG